MNKIQTFQEFLASQSVHIPVWEFAFNMILALVLAYFLGLIYVKFGRSISNRDFFAKNFILMAMTTMLVITIVKSSLALSLGLVGALSIVRFRAAIKEPEELSYLFFAIAIGLGLGANQRIITIVGFTIITVVLGVIHFFKQDTIDNQNLHLTVASKKPNRIELQQIVDILKDTCTGVNLKRIDDTGDLIDASFLIELDNFSNLEKMTTNIRQLDKSATITFLDNKNIAG